MPKFFIRRPVVAMVISILIVIVGVVVLGRLPVAQFPDIAPIETVVTTTYTGADAQTIEQSVATPIEQAMTGVEGMIYMRSFNANDGTMKLRVDFDIGTPPDTDEMFTYIRMARAAPALPKEVRDYGLTVAKSHTSPLMIVSLYSPKGTRDAKFIANYGYINITDPITRVPGIGSVTVQGAGQYAMRQWVEPDQLAKLGITITDVLEAIEKSNAVNPAGQVGAEPVPAGQEFTYTMRARGRLLTPEEFGNIIVQANPDGSFVRVRDVARIELGAQYYNLIGRFNGKPAAIINCFQLPGYNALDAAKGVRELMAQLKKQFPDDLDYVISLDTTLSVTEGVKEIVTTLWQALALVMLVVMLFLQGWRATLIPTLTVPVSLIGTFVLFPLFGFSINTLSLFGLVLAIGLVVDDAIVVVEAVEHHIERGLAPRDATIRAMEEVSGPVIGIALVLSAVFVPAAFIPGITGRLYQQFALTIAFSVLISAFNALSLSPALCALLLRPRSKGKTIVSRAFGVFNRGFDRLTEGYVGASRYFIRKFVRSIVLLVAFTAASWAIGVKLPPGFLPVEDQGYFYVNLELPSAASLQRTNFFSRKVEELLLGLPGVRYVSASVGTSLLAQANATYYGYLSVALIPWNERTAKHLHAEEMIRDLNRRLATFGEGEAFAYSPPAISGVGTSGGFSFMLEDRSGRDVEFLSQETEKFLNAAARRPELGRLHSSLSVGVPQIFATVDEDKVLKEGIDLRHVYDALKVFMGGKLVNYFNRFGRAWPVYVAAEGEYRTVAEHVGKFFVRNHEGEMVPLSTLVKLERRHGPEFTSRFNEYRCAEITGSPAAGYGSTQAMMALTQVAKEMRAGMGYEWNALSYQEAGAAKKAGPAIIFALSLLIVFLVLAALYESWSLPFSVLLTLPIAIFGAFAALWARNLENDVYSQIGLVMLIGLAAKNAILIVEFARAERKKGKSIIDAALEGGRLRLRPILMTSFAFILGALPLALATGSGAAARRILGTAVIGGMLAATCLAIFLVPVTYTLVERLVRGNNPEELSAATSPAPAPNPDNLHER